MRTTYEREQDAIFPRWIFFVDIYCRSVLVGFITAALWTTCLAESDMESSQIFPLKKVENGQNSKQAGRRCGHNSARADIRAAPNERRISIGLFSRWNITRKQGQLQDASICFTETTRSQQLKMFNLRMSLFSDLSRKTGWIFNKKGPCSELRQEACKYKIRSINIHTL